MEAESSVLGFTKTFPKGIGMAFGSWLRFGVGIVLALEVVRSQFFGGGESLIAVALAVILLALSAAYFLFKF